MKSTLQFYRTCANRLRPTKQTKIKNLNRQVAKTPSFKNSGQNHSILQFPYLPWRLGGSSFFLFHLKSKIHHPKFPHSSPDGETKHIKNEYKLTFALVASLTSTAFAAFQAPLPEFKNEKQLAEWRTERASEATSQGFSAKETAFYTGKPYIESTGGYTFKHRSYSPEMARWTSEDPSGFPDGPNPNIYAAIPTSQLDFCGLWRVSLVAGANDNRADNNLTPGGRILSDSTQSVTSTTFGISSESKLGIFGSWVRSQISGSVSVSPGGNEIQLSWDAGSDEIKPGLLVNSAVSVANITYSDNNKTVSFNFSYGGNTSLSGLSVGPAGVSTTSTGFKSGFGTIRYTLVE
jgi:RHS repeat-associated protein